MRRDSAGVAIVESWAPARNAARGWQVGPEPTLEIGVVDGDPDYEFSWIQRVFRLP